MEETKICEQCRIRFEPKRSDQKFCSLKCKNKRNNKIIKAINIQRKNEDIISRETNTVLMANRNLLKANLDKQVLMKDLENLGFKLNVISGFEHPKEEKNPRLFCYDYGYQFIDSTTVKIFKK